MTEPNKKTRLILVGAFVALIVAAGVAVTVLGPGRPISYTGSFGNPSPTAGSIAPIPAAERQPAPKLAFDGPDGKPASLDALKGKVLVVNLWATWCPPCIAEMPSLNALQKDLGGETFQVVAISLDRGGAPIAMRWLDQAGLSALAVHTANANDFPNALLPTSWLIDAQGRVAWTGAGRQDWHGEDALAAVRALLAEGG